MTATPLRVAVMLPFPYRGGTLKAAKNVARMISRGSQMCGEPAQVVFSAVEDGYTRKDFGELVEMGIRVRETKWTTVRRDEIELFQKFSGHEVPLRHDTYNMPGDGASNFDDFDLWVVISDRSFFPIAPLKPYGVVVHDYIQRYMPEILGMGPEADGVWEHAFLEGFLGTVRQADFVLTTTPRTRRDAINYAGVSPEKVFLAPMDFEPRESTSSPVNFGTDFLAWATSTGFHENHMAALEALETYYDDLDGRLLTRIVGFQTHLFDPKRLDIHLKGDDRHERHILMIRERIRTSRTLRKSIRGMGHVSEGVYNSVLSQAKFTWHPNRIDNGTYSVIEAADLGTPSLSSNYPQMHFIDERFGLNLAFCNSDDVADMAEKLKEMELTYELRKAMLPSSSQLRRYSWENLSEEFWGVLKAAAL